MSNPTGRNADPRRTIPLNTARWQKLRHVVLHREPLCRDCRAHGLVTEATDVDHISGDPSDNSLDNLQALCHACHSRKTARGNRVIGCDVNGWPLDPGHPWNQEKDHEQPTRLDRRSPTFFTDKDKNQ